MSRKPLHVKRSGVGEFPRTGVSPEMVTVRSAPIMSSDEWELAGRPFWLVRWQMSPAASHPAAGGYLHGRTMTPAFCPLAVCGIPPIQSVRVLCGTMGMWVDAEWTEVRDVRQHNRIAGKDAHFNPVKLVTWDSLLTQESAQLYAAPGDIRSSRPVPVLPSETQYRQPADPVTPGAAESVLLDDGCPHYREGE